MMDSSRFTTATLERLPAGAAVQRILAAAIQAVEPGAAVRRAVQRDGDELQVRGEPYRLDETRQVFLAALGKAALPMAEALAEVLGESLSAGLVVSKQAGTSLDQRLKVLQGAHPVPDERSLAAGVALLDFLTQAGPDDLVFFMISGGGSALVTAPLEGITLADLQQLTSALLACGADIGEINTLRRCLDRVKGGGLARQAYPARQVSLILSDVVGSPLEAIASGPTVPDPTTRQDALAVIEHYQLQASLPSSIVKALQDAPGGGTPGGGAPAGEDPISPGSSYFTGRCQHMLVGSNLIAAQAALRQAEAEGFHPYLLRTDLTGEAREAAFELSQVLRWSVLRGDPIPPPACIIAGGETTVTLQGDGLGGRNQELALAAAVELAGFPSVLLAALATDGEDGPTDAAGAVVTGQTYQQAQALGLDPSDFLSRNDAYNFFAPLGDLLKPGPTGTNVNDLIFLFAL